ncbi:MAG: hypothetical protein IIZ70_02380 [Kiritimatiellae bacterium]|nr:hypothetical protein [Kiritimatiellia bacterium]
MRRAQATVETLIAVLAILMMFFAAYRYSRMLAARTLLDHAAARAARAKAVGFNDFMCEKSARVAMIPVAGARTWPAGIDDVDEVSRIPMYLSADDWPLARGILDYEFWPSTYINVRSGQGLAPVAESAVGIWTPDYEMTGRAAVESHFPHYMFDQGR